jgi:LuxR family transcriptional regulator, positive regulator of biofilm formation
MQNIQDFYKMKKISKAEQEIISFVMKGMSNKEIANSRFVTEKTVKFHLTNIYKKLTIKSRHQLIVMFANFGYIKPGPKTVAEMFGKV